MATTETATLDAAELGRLDAFWRAANYLSVGQIYLLANPLLREPLAPEHIKPRLLGHFGTTPGLNLVYVHVNRAITARDLNAIFIAGPGHGGPAVVANAYLEGTYSELYSHVGRDEAGLKALFRQFSFPGGIPSHAAPEVPGSMHEGGELGYALTHAFGAAFDKGFEILCFSAATFLLTALGGIVVSLAIGGWPAFETFGLNFFISAEWRPDVAHERPRVRKSPSSSRASKSQTRTNG